MRGAIAVCALFVVFMVNVDVPMYWGRWREQQAQGLPMLGLLEGLHAATHVWVVTHELAPWRDEMAWMALYFSAGVWISIALGLAPAGPARGRTEEPKF